MDALSRIALVAVGRDAFFAVLAGMVLMIGCSYDPPLALVISASIAMLYTTVMLVRAVFLTDEKVASTDTWQEIRPEERPLDEAGLAFARARMQTAMLGAAKNAAGIASAMFALGLFLDLA
jgi:hypothetical protein